MKGWRRKENEENERKRLRKEGKTGGGEKEKINMIPWGGTSKMLAHIYCYLHFKEGNTFRFSDAFSVHRAGGWPGRGLNPGMYEVKAFFSHLIAQKSPTPRKVTSRNASHSELISSSRKGGLSYYHRPQLAVDPLSATYNCEPARESRYASIHRGLPAGLRTC